MPRSVTPPAGRPARVFVVDDHPIVRRGLRELIDQHPDLAVSGEAPDAESALASIRVAPPDVAVVDLSLRAGPSGLDLLRDLSQQVPSVATLVLSMHEEYVYAERALRAGARGYVMKDEASETIIDAIRAVLGGGLYLSPAFAAQREALVESGQAPHPAASVVETLSNRELEVFQLIGAGFTTRDIAARLELSVKTIETHRAHIKRKLGIQTASDLIRAALQWADDVLPPPTGR